MHFGDSGILSIVRVHSAINCMGDVVISFFDERADS